MNTIKNKQEEKKSTPRQRRMAKGFRKVVGLSSDIPSNETLKVVLLITILAVLYMMNAYNAERKTIEINKLTQENKELRAEYLLLKSKGMYASSQSAIARQLKDKGIKEATVPPGRITKNSNE